MRRLSRPLNKGELLRGKIMDIAGRGHNSYYKDRHGNAHYVKHALAEKAVKSLGWEKISYEEGRAIDLEKNLKRRLPK